MMTFRVYFTFYVNFSAGVGRTGVFITLSIVLERMQYEGVLDVFQTVRVLRAQRPAMVQTEVSGKNLLGIFSILSCYVIHKMLDSSQNLWLFNIQLNFV